MVSNHPQEKVKASNTTPALQQSSTTTGLFEQSSGGAAAVASAPVILSPSSTASTEAPLLDPSPSPSVLHAILKEIPQFWVPVSLKEELAVLRPRLEKIFSIIQKYDVLGGKASVVFSYFKDMLDQDSLEACGSRFSSLYKLSNDAELDLGKMAVALLKVFRHKNYDAYEQILKPTIGDKENIKTALERLRSLASVYDVPVPATAVSRLLSLLLSKPGFSSLSNFRGSDDYAGLLKGAIGLCNYYLDKGNSLPIFNRVPNNNSTKAGQLSFDYSFPEDVGNVISECKLKSLIKDGVALDEAIVLARISSTSGQFLDSTSPGDFQRTDSDFPLTYPKLKSERDEQQEQQLTLLSDLLPSHWLPIDHAINSVVLQHQLKIVFQTLAIILPPSAPITTHIELLRKVSSDEFSMLLYKYLPKELPSLKGPEFPSTSKVIKAIMEVNADEDSLDLVCLEYPRPWEGESTVEFLDRLKEEAEIWDWEVPSTSSRNLICLLANNSPQFSSLLGFENLYHNYQALLNKAIAIAKLCEDGGYPIKLGTDDKWSGRKIKSEDENEEQKEGKWKHVVFS